MPTGTLVSDSLAPNLLAATVTATGTGTIKTVEYPWKVRAELKVAACSGADTQLFVYIEQGDDAALSVAATTEVLGGFALLGATSDNTTHWLDVEINRKYVRAGYTKLGTGTEPSYTITSLYLHEDDYKRTKGDEA